MFNQQNIRYFLIIGIILILNLLSSAYFKRFDLTKEKRYSLSEVSVNTMDSLRYPMTFQIYMEGEYPPNIGRFQDAIRSTLVEMQQYANGNLDFEFIDPKNNNELIQELTKRGMPPIPVTVKTSEMETENKKLFPYAYISYRGKEKYIDLVKGCVLPNGQLDFAGAEGDLEYKLVSPVRGLIKENAGNIAIVEGHGEIPIEMLGEWITGMQNTYNVFRYDMKKNAGNGIAPTVSEEDMKKIGKDIPENLKYRSGIDVLIIAQPQKPFSEREKYEIDQYLMRGGSIFFILGQEIVDMDMFEKRSTLTQLRELNLDDLFLKYGFKINYNLIQDLSCEKTEVFTESSGGGSFQSLPWIFYPMVYQFPNSPISRNTDQVLLRYASSIDTIPQKGVTKQVFLTSSPDSRTVDGQQFIDLNTYLQEKPPVQLFKNKGNKITGVMIEGMFTSLFAGREAPVDSASPNPPSAIFGERSALPGHIGVISDGNFPMGKIFRGKRGYIPYDNKTILMNAVDYLAGDDALTKIRAKEVKIRMLDREKVTNNTFLIRIINLLLPVSLVALFGIVRMWLRKKRNSAFLR
ncbi:MAG: gliding motility-associated ABC transporter substrate-binding protein GldG [Bacteroidia bacterium]|nr:gliding motility-associated ABC transporter substrate-binding protein GldG [Bacteroidia bacterium]